MKEIESVLYKVLDKYLKKNGYNVKDFDIMIEYNKKPPKPTEEKKSKQVCPTCNSQCEEINMRYWYCKQCRHFL